MKRIFSRLLMPLTVLFVVVVLTGCCHLNARTASSETRDYDSYRGPYGQSVAVMAQSQVAPQPRPGPRPEQGELPILNDQAPPRPETEASSASQAQVFPGVVTHHKESSSFDAGINLNTDPGVILDKTVGAVLRCTVGWVFGCGRTRDRGEYCYTTVRQPDPCRQCAPSRESYYSCPPPEAYNNYPNTATFSTVEVPPEPAVFREYDGGYVTDGALYFHEEPDGRGGLGARACRRPPEFGRCRPTGNRFTLHSTGLVPYRGPASGRTCGRGPSR